MRPDRNVAFPAQPSLEPRLAAIIVSRVRHAACVRLAASRQRSGTDPALRPTTHLNPSILNTNPDAPPRNTHEPIQPHRYDRFAGIARRHSRFDCRTRAAAARLSGP